MKRRLENLFLFVFSNYRLIFEPLSLLISDSSWISDNVFHNFSNNTKVDTFTVTKGSTTFLELSNYLICTMTRLAHLLALSV